MATTHSAAIAKVVPAQLSFLAIYNPAFGQTDETAHDQIFYYFAKRDLDKQRKHGDAQAGRSKGASEDESVDDAHNERLRQVGLARGMVEFAK